MQRVKFLLCMCKLRVLIHNMYDYLYIDAVLSDLAYSSEVLEKFKQEKVIAGCWLVCYRFSRPGILLTHNFHQINLHFLTVITNYIY